MAAAQHGGDGAARRTSRSPDVGQAAE